MTGGYGPCLALILWIGAWGSLVNVSPSEASAANSGIVAELSEAEAGLRAERAKAYATVPDFAILDRHLATLKAPPPEELTETIRKLKEHYGQATPEQQGRIGRQMSELGGMVAVRFWLDNTEDREVKQATLKWWFTLEPARLQAFKSISESQSNEPAQLASDVQAYFQKYRQDRREVMARFRFGGETFSRKDYERLLNEEIRNLQRPIITSVVSHLKPEALVEAETRVTAIKIRMGKHAEDLDSLRLEAQAMLEGAVSSMDEVVEALAPSPYTAPPNRGQTQTAELTGDNGTSASTVAQNDDGRGREGRTKHDGEPDSSRAGWRLPLLAVFGVVTVVAVLAALVRRSRTRVKSATQQPNT